MLSSQVANAIQFIWKDAASGTVKFIEMMDKFFDCLNVRAPSVGKVKRKPFQNSYTNCNDFRIQVIFKILVLLFIFFYNSF